MHKRLAEITDFLDRTRSGLMKSVEGATRDQMARKAKNGGWSVAEILDHLGIVEAMVAKLIAKSIARGKTEGVGKETSEESLIGTFDAFSFPNTKEPFQAPGLSIPRSDPDPDEVLANLASSREALRAALESADGMDLGSIQRDHLILGPLNLYQWALFIGQHEARHTSQITRTLKEIK
jgi:hypothetical protein